MEIAHFFNTKTKKIFMRRFNEFPKKLVMIHRIFSIGLLTFPDFSSITRKKG